MGRNKAWQAGGLFAAVALAVAACGSAVSGSAVAGPGTAGSHATLVAADTAPAPGMLTAAQACRKVVPGMGKGFFTGVQQVHLVYTTYGKGEPAESGGDLSYTVPAGTAVWVVEVHAKAVNWDHSELDGYTPPAKPYTDYSVVMNARTGQITDAAECYTCWPLPLSTVGALVSLPPQC